MNFEDYIKTLSKDIFKNKVEFIGVVEDNMDPMTLGRVRVRCFNIHPEDKEAVPTEHLPWAVVLQPTNSANVSGIGWSPNGLEMGSWVHGFFMDGENCQYPVVDGVFPVVHRGNPPDVPGGMSAAYGPPYDNSGSSAPTDGAPYHGTPVENQPYYDPLSGQLLPNDAVWGHGSLAAAGPINMILTKEHISKWNRLGLPTYNWQAAPNGYACKDGKASLAFHYGTALAFEKLTKEWGQGKLYINSAYRTRAYNARLPGAATNSMHIQGRALDVGGFSYSNLDRAIAFARVAVRNGFVGFGLYSTFIHIDTGSGRVWNGAANPKFIAAIKQEGWYQGKPGLTGISTNAGNSDGTQATDANGNPIPVSGTEGPPGTYRPVYNLSEADLSDAVVNTIAGEAYTNNQDSVDAVINNMLNRVGTNAYGPSDDLYQVARANGQYAGYRNASASEASYIRSRIRAISSGGVPDITGGSNEYRAGSYTGPWGRKHANSPVIGGNRFAYNPKGGIGPYGPYSMESSKVAMPGFTDPTNSLPYVDYRGEPSTHKNARGINAYPQQHILEAKDAGRTTGVPIAGNIGTFGEPEQASNPQYPYNRTYATKTHLLEFDDTPGSERVNVQHKSGSGIEIFANGNQVHRTKGDKIVSDDKNLYHSVLGKAMVTSVDDMHLRTTGDLVIHSDGAQTQIIGGDKTAIISGDITISGGSDIRLKGVKLILEGDSVDILSNADLNIEAKGAVNMKAETLNSQSTKAMNMNAGEGMNMKAGGDMKVSASTVYADDVVRVGEGGGSSEQEDLKGASTSDVGPPPKRSVVKKNNVVGVNDLPNNITNSEAREVYS